PRVLPRLERLDALPGAVEALAHEHRRIRRQVRLVAEGPRDALEEEIGVGAEVGRDGGGGPHPRAPLPELPKFPLEGGFLGGSGPGAPGGLERPRAERHPSRHAPPPHRSDDTPALLRSCVLRNIIAYTAISEGPN